MKIKLELNISGDEIFLNYWDFMNGNDKCLSYKNGKLYDHHNNMTEVELYQFIDHILENEKSEMGEGV